MSRRSAAEVTASVRAFYDRMPFNCAASARADAASLRADAIEVSLPDLHRLLASGDVASVLDVGCGTGWLANTIALRYRIPALGVDLSETAIRRARRVARAAGTHDLAAFVAADLFEFVPEAPADLVASVGVLHHTHSAAKGFARIAGFVAPGGHVHVGLYHRYGRAPFLELFREIVARDGEEAAFRRYREMDPARGGDAKRLRSWFRDQVLHPHETRHTLREVAGWIATAGFELRSTSLNGFEPFDGLEELFELEPLHEEISRRANCVEGRFFPGFFTVLAQRAD